MPLPKDLPAKALTVHEAAALLSVSVDTLRRWAKKGLVQAARSRQGYRLFNPDEVERMRTKLRGDAAAYKVLPRLRPPTRLSAIELFSGCGGLALGLELSGIDSEMLVEMDRDACATLRMNWPKKCVIENDVAAVDFRPHRGKVDVVAGGFPCQAFSYAGFGRGFQDTRGSAFFEFARCIKETRPKIALGENVRGLIKHDHGRTLETMLATLWELGYRPSFHLLRAQFLDVPQKRERLIIIAVRNDLDIPALFPKENYYTVSLREALTDVPDSPGQAYPEKKRKVMSMISEGRYWTDLPDALQREYMGASYYHTGGRTGMARRLAWDEPCLTLTCSPMQKQTERCHPEKTRPLTTREYARIQTFPDKWKFSGSTASVYRQVGNAVPVNLGHHVGRCVVAMLDPTRSRNGMFEVPAQTPSKRAEMALAV